MPSWPGYSTVALADTYHAAHGSPAAWTGATTLAKEGALRFASEWLDQVYGPRWVGRRATETQERDWPRYGASYDNGVSVPETTIPDAVRDACAYMALRYLTDGDLNPVLAFSGDVRMQPDKVGALETEVEYLGGKSQNKVYQAVDSMLRARGLIGGGSQVWRA